ncbi:tRNA (N6-threonylcarbamoyladenosine(37)-N6)-methyltransferase TrmO [Thermomicrobiaceae bacterium CFH 74404]|uniref:tRNA (N6-threonylcarbamoyladenosine(37)-N6)-methyltransferase TrmO n=1 Tax=Thermalbibacter longus TaxID=2951981 RepID=A0AA41W9X9_9BACT|nr:tRNA (N6-threonylcarbamoyladenosine(37)-N6)-methyltransferase TrmO [Thermalbibacter longus]MCM8748046.1 tRNA (N6-threonylcarbamoyladenosine(37)-N6)-methyltransferase TrmO [Thermalbibacter longus]
MLQEDRFDVYPIGVVRSRIADRRLMPPQGIRAEIEIFPEFEDGLLRIEENSHIWVIGWLHEGDRHRLQLVRPEYEPTRRRRGVFGLRSVARPNLLSLSACWLLAIERNRLVVDPLELIDGTPVLDIKRYSVSWDCIFSARSSRDRYLIDLTGPERLAEFEREAANFHGECCPWVVAGARLIQHLHELWGIRPKDDALIVTISLAPELAHLADTLQALTGATFGSGRLRVDPAKRIAFEHGERWLALAPGPLPAMDLDTIRALPITELFAPIEN